MPLPSISLLGFISWLELGFVKISPTAETT